VSLSMSDSRQSPIPCRYPRECAASSLKRIERSGKKCRCAAGEGEHERSVEVEHLKRSRRSAPRVFSQRASDPDMGERSQVETSLSHSFVV
jgi:hypothetical protein